MAAIEAEGLRRTYKTHTGTVRRKAKEIEDALLRWFEILSRRHASLERS
jgi:hypothetical protein